MSYYRRGPFRPGSTVTFGIPSLTPMVKLLIIVNAVVWFLEFTLEGIGLPVTRWLGVTPSWVIRGALWQPVTYMFLHDPGGPFHLLLNMLMLWMFGGELERYWGGRSFLRYYLICGVGGGLFATVMGLFTNPNIPTIGASGAIFGLFMAYGMVFAERTVLFMMIFPMKARTMALILFALTFFYTWGQSGAGVSHIAHLGGAIVGYLYLKRVWRFGDFYRDLRWKLRRRRFRVMQSEERDDIDRWVN